MPKAYDEGWTDARVAMMLKLRDTGLGMTAIATQMSLTRSAVIGKLHRMGQSAGRLKNAKGAMGLVPTKTVDVGRRRLVIPKHLQRTKQLAAKIPTASLLPSPVDLPILSERGVASQGTSSAGLIKSIVDLLPSSCRWPIGDPREADFSFCGKDRKPNSPYCPDCHARAYAGVSTRRPALPMRKAA